MVTVLAALAAGALMLISYSIRAAKDQKIAHDVVTINAALSTFIANGGELDEAERLSRDMRKTPKEIAADSTLLKYFANQFAVRMNGGKRYSAEKMAMVLEDLAG